MMLKSKSILLAGIAISATLLLFDQFVASAAVSSCSIILGIRYLLLLCLSPEPTEEIEINIVPINTPNPIDTKPSEDDLEAAVKRHVERSAERVKNIPILQRTILSMSEVDDYMEAKRKSEAERKK